MKKEDFLTKERYKSLFLAKEGKAYVSSIDGEEEVSELSMLSYLSYNIILEDAYTLYDFFLFLNKNQKPFSLLSSETVFLDYLNFFKDNFLHNFAYFPEKISFINITYIFSYSKGESRYQKQLKNEILGDAPTLLKRGTKILLPNVSEDDSDDFFRSLDLRKKEEIKAQLKVGSYKSYCDEKAFSQASLDLSVMAPAEVYKNGKLIAHNAKKMLAYSCSGYKFSELLRLPIVIGEAMVQNEDQRFSKKALTNFRGIDLFSFFQAVMNELSWESPKGRESQELTDDLKAQLWEIKNNKDK